ncbi:hypothetical protein KCU89_g11421, partial [Aureobasidium melanogenum]
DPDFTPEANRTADEDHVGVQRLAQEALMAPKQRCAPARRRQTSKINKDTPLPANYLSGVPLSAALVAGIADYMTDLVQHESLLDFVVSPLSEAVLRSTSQSSLSSMLRNFRVTDLSEVNGAGAHAMEKEAYDSVRPSKVINDRRVLDPRPNIFRPTNPAYKEIVDLVKPAMASRFDLNVHRARQEDLLISCHYNLLTDIRLHERFPRASDYQIAKPSLEWFLTIDGRVATAFESLRITDLWIEQLSLISALSKYSIFSIIPNYLITRACRVVATIMQVCAEVSLQKGRNPPTPITEDEFDAGTFARPYQLVVVPDDDMDPLVWMDAYTVAHDTGVKLSTPSINITYPGDEYQYLANADVVFASIDRIKKLVGTRAISLSCVNRIIVDEPLYINKATWYSLGMLLR